jgi:hypothetical protein
VRWNSSQGTKWTRAKNQSGSKLQEGGYRKKIVRKGRRKSAATLQRRWVVWPIKTVYSFRLPHKFPCLAIAELGSGRWFAEIAFVPRVSLGTVLYWPESRGLSVFAWVPNWLPPPQPRSVANKRRKPLCACYPTQKCCGCLECGEAAPFTSSSAILDGCCVLSIYFFSPWKSRRMLAMHELSVFISTACYSGAGKVTVVRSYMVKWDLSECLQIWSSRW